MIHALAAVRRECGVSGSALGNDECGGGGNVERSNVYI
jgi:hypothetical protein